MKYFLGFDVGSSKTHALIIDATGKCVGFGKSHGGNHQRVGYEGLNTVLQDSFHRARTTSGVDTAQIARAAFGVAGYDFQSDREPQLNAIASLGLSCPIELFNDGLNGLLAGATRGIGVNVTAGSSNNCRGRNKHGKHGRIVGNGPNFGEFGGGIEIAARALQMVNYAWIKRIPPTTLTQVFLHATGTKTVLDMMEAISNKRYHLTPDLGVRVIQAAQAGDMTAKGVVYWAGEELGWLAVAVARQIEMEDEKVEIIQSGSVFEAGELLTKSMQKVVMKHCPKANLIRLQGPPVVGAVIFAMEQAGVDGYIVRDNIVRTAKVLIQ